MLIAIAIAEEIQALQWCQNPTEDLLGLSAPHEPIFFEDLLRLPPGLHAQNNSTIQCKHPRQFRKSQREIFVVLGSLLQWRWQ